MFLTPAILRGVFIPNRVNLESVVKMDRKKLILSAAAFTLISFAVNFIGAIEDMGYYTAPANAALWSKEMMPSNASPPFSFFILTIAFTFISSLVIAYAFSISKQAFYSKKAFSADRAWVAGAKFGLFIFLLLHLSGFFTMYMLLSIPTGLLFSWLVQGFFSSMLGGMAMARLME